MRPIKAAGPIQRFDAADNRPSVHSIAMRSTPASSLQMRHRPAFNPRLKRNIVDALGLANSTRYSKGPILVKRNRRGLHLSNESGGINSKGKTMEHTEMRV